MKRCSWCNENNPLYVAYHDQEWGVRRMDDAYLFEMLLLELFQAGRRAYDDFDLEKVAGYGEAKIEQLMADKGIIRNRRKIEASIRNAQIFQQICQEFGSFASYLRTFTNDAIRYERGRTTNVLSDALSKDLKQRGMRFVGSTIIYAYLQAIGVIDSHEEDCFLCSDPTVRGREADR